MQAREKVLLLSLRVSTNSRIRLQPLKDFFRGAIAPARASAPVR
jgi:hypothetical protein